MYHIRQTSKIRTPIYPQARVRTLFNPLSKSLFPPILSADPKIPLVSTGGKPRSYPKNRGSFRFQILQLDPATDRGFNQRYLIPCFYVGGIEEKCELCPLFWELCPRSGDGACCQRTPRIATPSESTQIRSSSDPVLPAAVLTWLSDYSHTLEFTSVSIGKNSQSQVKNRGSFR